MYQSGRADEAGGKARSIPVPGSGVGGRADLPGEHGFRFYPAFYKHIPDTMSRIPFGGRSVRENLTPCARLLISQFGRTDIKLNGRFPRSPADWLILLNNIFGGQFGVPREEVLHFGLKMTEYLGSCEARRLAEYEKIAWWDYIGAETRSVAYQKLIATGLTRCLTAMKPREASTRTVASILVQLLVPFADPAQTPDRVLAGPTNDMWIDPWMQHLRTLGVVFQFDHELVSLTTAAGRVSSARIRRASGPDVTVTADQFVVAVPVEVMERVAAASPGIVALDPALGRLGALRWEWMTGIQYFLNRDVSIAAGHVIHIDSPWAITSISEKQFWPSTNLANYGDGVVAGVLSVDVSDWNQPGRFNGKKAIHCTRDELLDEVWSEIKAHVNEAGAPPVLVDADVHSRFLDPAIEFPLPDAPTNKTPLLVNIPDSWRDRPEATTAIPNLFLASDYVRTITDLASMEAANEAARRAVNGILAETGSRAARCRIFPFEEPWIFAPIKALDWFRYRLGC
ncbi:phytoene dehydrogenase [Deltaproteobacteria bacterium]|nr:phytoene dehydrogenase [Deltaproteobacteria bacterium]